MNLEYGLKQTEQRRRCVLPFLRVQNNREEDTILWTGKLLKWLQAGLITGERQPLSSDWTMRELDRGVVENKGFYLTGRMLCLRLWVWLSWWSTCSDCMKPWIPLPHTGACLNTRSSKVQGHPPFIASLRPAWAWIIGNPDKTLLFWYLGGRQAVVSFSEDALLELKAFPASLPQLKMLKQF